MLDPSGKEFRTDRATQYKQRYLFQVSSCSNTGSIRDDLYWTSRKNSLELIELSSVTKVTIGLIQFILPSYKQFFQKLCPRCLIFQTPPKPSPLKVAKRPFQGVRKARTSFQGLPTSFHVEGFSQLSPFYFAWHPAAKTPKKLSLKC